MSIAIGFVYGCFFLSDILDSTLQTLIDIFRYAYYKYHVSIYVLHILSDDF